MSDVRCCPECQSAAIRHALYDDDAHNALAETDAHWSCEDCGARFDEPSERDARGPRRSPDGILKTAGFDSLVGGDSS